MSYADFKRYQGEFDEIFGKKSKITLLESFPNEKLNMVLSSAHIIGTLKPILEDMFEKDLDDLKVALIPNAANYTDSGKMEMAYGYLEQFTTLNNMYMKLLDIVRWPKDLVIDSLKKADIIAVNGGYVSSFLHAVDEAGIRNELTQMLFEGKPYIGFSAGAMVMSRTTYFAENYINEQDVNVVKEKPLGIVNFEVYPHFEDVMLPSLEKIIPPNVKSFALKDTQALIITKGKLFQAGNVTRIS